MRPCSHLPQILALPAWRLQGFAKLPWEVSMSSEDAAKTLGKFLGVPDLQPASVLNLDVQQVREQSAAVTTQTAAVQQSRPPAFTSILPA